MNKNSAQNIMDDAQSKIYQACSKLMEKAMFAEAGGQGQGTYYLTFI